MITIKTNNIATNPAVRLPWDLIQQKVKELPIKTIEIHKVNNYSYKNANSKSLGTILKSCMKRFAAWYLNKTIKS